MLLLNCPSDLKQHSQRPLQHEWKAMEIIITVDCRLCLRGYCEVSIFKCPSYWLFYTLLGYSWVLAAINNHTCWSLLRGCAKAPSLRRTFCLWLIITQLLLSTSLCFSLSFAASISLLLYHILIWQMIQKLIKQILISLIKQIIIRQHHRILPLQKIRTPYSFHFCLFVSTVWQRREKSSRSRNWETAQRESSSCHLI